MSHTTTIRNVPIRDIEALKATVRELQEQGIPCELVEKAVPRMYYPNQSKACDYVLRLPQGAYDVGFSLQSDGTYAPVFDEFGGHVGKYLGAACPIPNSKEGRAQHCIGKLMQGYSKHAAINHARDMGFMVTDTSVDTEGQVVLTFAGF